MATSEQKTTRAKTALSITFGLAVLLNLADALWGLPGAAWLTVRIVVSVLFTIALIVFIALWFSRRREPRLHGRQ
jgi:membrane protein implicated in regulation of membrane protease activity